MRARFTLAVALLAAALTACGAPTVTSTEDKEAAISKPTGDTGSGGEASANKPATAKIGSVITLTGFDNAKVAVKLSRVFPNAASAIDGIGPDPGNRFYGVELVLKNVGDTAYEDSPSNCALVIDSEGQQYSTTIVDLKGGTSFGGSVTLAPGDVRKGVIGFEVPKNAKITRLQFALNSGMADHKGIWHLTK